MPLSIIFFSFSAHQNAAFVLPLSSFSSVIENDKIISIDNDEPSHSITTLTDQLTQTCIHKMRLFLPTHGDSKYARTVYAQ